MWVREHFAKCWRGEETLGTTFFATVLVAVAINGPINFLWVFAAQNWPRAGRLAISLLGLVGAIFVTTWFTVSMWRASRSSFLRGARFWPIVGSLVAAALPAIVALAFVTGFLGGLPR